MISDDFVNFHFLDDDVPRSNFYEVTFLNLLVDLIECLVTDFNGHNKILLLTSLAGY